ncbi:MAG: hypothetical protein PF448_02920 [Bacteroidales bacterium]|nr:hypothetical protein [Bacteroidales bacterium]
MFTTTTTYKAFNQRLIGRFLSPDPYGQFYSAYTGMGNNPVNLVDPSGGYVKHWRIAQVTSQKSYPRFGEGGGTLIDVDYIDIFIDFGPGPTGGGGNSGSTGPGCGSGGGSGSPNSDSHLSGPSTDEGGEDYEPEVVMPGVSDAYGTGSGDDPPREPLVKIDTNKLKIKIEDQLISIDNRDKYTRRASINFPTQVAQEAKRRYKLETGKELNIRTKSLSVEIQVHAAFYILEIRIESTEVADCGEKEKDGNRIIWDIITWDIITIIDINKK